MCGVYTPLMISATAPSFSLIMKLYFYTTQTPVLFNLYLDEVIRILLQKLKLSKYFKELIFNTLLFADDQLVNNDTEDDLQRAVYLLYKIFKEYNLEIATGKAKVFGFFGTDHLRAKIIINDETLQQFSQFTYLGCSISY